MPTGRCSRRRSSRLRCACPGARTVFLLHDVEGYTHEEIAESLGITSGGSKSQLFKARAKLRKLLAPLVDLPRLANVNLSVNINATPLP